MQLRRLRLLLKYSYPTGNEARKLLKHGKDVLPGLCYYDAALGKKDGMIFIY